MIKIQSKQAKADARAGTGDAYQFNEPDQNSRTPLAVAAFFTALLVYFKSMFGAQAAPHAAAGVGSHMAPEDTLMQPEPISTADAAPADDEKPKDKADPADLADPPRRIGSTRPVFSDLLNDERLPDFDRIAALHARRQAEAQTFSEFAKNDNAPVTAAREASPKRGEEIGPGDSGGRQKPASVAAGSSGHGAPGGGNGANSGAAGANAGSDPESNRPPRVGGPVRLPSVVQSHSLFIPLALLLSGAVDPDQNALAVGGLKVSSGALVELTGGWLFTPAPGDLGSVTLTYAVSDGAEQVTQTALLDVVRAAVIFGGEADDLLLGTDDGDEINGGAGSDNIDARGGSDVIRGGVGGDHIVAGAGNDVVYAGAGDDVVYGGEGNDIIYGGSGDDWLSGGTGDDILDGEDGDDVALGGPGADQLFGARGDDTIHGDDGRDYADGGDGNDMIFGDAGDDVLADGLGSDLVAGGAGDDVVLASIDAANDTLRGDSGFDTLSYADATDDLTIDFGTGRAASAEIGTDNVSGFEVMVAGAGNDVLTAGAATVQIAAGAGADVVTGGSGDDTLLGQDGDDRLADGGGADLVEGGAGDDFVFASIDAANDHFAGDSGFDTLSYAEATASILFDAVAGTASSEATGADSITGFEALIGGSGDDTFLIGVKPLVLQGGAGDDTFTFAGVIADLSQHEAARLVHEIDDLEPGDRIVYKSFEIQRLTLESLGPSANGGGASSSAGASGAEGSFAAAYDPDPQASRPFRFRSETVDQQDHTYIDVIGDLAADDVQFTIDVLGHGRFEYREHA